VDNHGRKVSEREAQQVAHERAVIARRSAGEFRLFASESTRPALRLVRTPAETAAVAPAPAVPAECPPGYFVADWDAAKKAQKAARAKARRDAKKVAVA
jgi:hypothetical protein